MPARTVSARILLEAGGGRLSAKRVAAFSPRSRAFCSSPAPTLPTFSFPGVDAHSRVSRAGRAGASRAQTGATASDRERLCSFSFGGVSSPVLFSLWSLDGIIALSPRNVPRFHETRIDFVALAFTAGNRRRRQACSSDCGRRCGFRASVRFRSNLHQGAGRAASEGTAVDNASGRVRVVAQMALALILLAAAGLTLKSFWRAQNAPLRFRSARRAQR